MTLPQKLKGFVSWGLPSLLVRLDIFCFRTLTYTLYPPLNRTFREPWFVKKSKVLGRFNVPEIETSRTLSDTAGPKACSWSV
jgi:hypothetical protein